MRNEFLSTIYPRAPGPLLAAIADQFDNVLGEYEIIDRSHRLHFFLAQIGHESGGLTVTEENLNYSAQRMMAVWPSRFPNLAATAGFVRNPEALANRVYGGRMGNAAAGDGWAYRGRGFVQITGKDGYAAVARVTGLDLVQQPDLVTRPEHALTAACGFWAWKRLNRLCDRGNFVSVTKRINGGTVGLQDRFAWLSRVQREVPWPLPETESDLSFEAALSIAQIRSAQRQLQALDLYAGSIDGIFGLRSRRALRIFQTERGLRPNGRLSAESLTVLLSQ